MRVTLSMRRKTRTLVTFVTILCLCVGAFTLFGGKSSSLVSSEDDQIIFIRKKPDFKEVKLLHKEEDKAVGENPHDAMIVEKELEAKKKEKEKSKVSKEPEPVEPPKKLKLSDNLDIQQRIYERQIQDDLAAVDSGLGAMGVAASLSGQEATNLDEIMKKEAFNRPLSDKISLNRTLPDMRNPKCKDVRYDHQLPSASVCIIFTNEAWSPLIRTIHSVLNRSPAHLLKEIVLVDDFSDKEELKGKLEYYISSRLPDKVKLLRLKERHGLIRARLAGAKAATGDVIVFLDSHCEATEGWLEPMLGRIKESRKAVLVPIIDVIDDKTLQYFNSNGDFFQIGGFTWSGHFTWINVPEVEKNRRGSPVAPTRSPTMAGGLFAIDREFFWESGSYDEGMDVWGGENLEMSFRNIFGRPHNAYCDVTNLNLNTNAAFQWSVISLRKIWMCGGTLETIPCSRVGHIFRSFHPYSFPGNKDTHGLNTARMVEVWMDDYKRLFYMYRPELQTDPLVGSVEERRKLREKMKCKSFKWYLDNVIPEKFILDEQSIAYGKVYNEVDGKQLCTDMLQRDEHSQYILGFYPCHNKLTMSQVRNAVLGVALCLDNLQRNEDEPYIMGYYPCHNFLASSQFLSLSVKNQLRREEMCATLDTKDSKGQAAVRMVQCDEGSRSQKWLYTSDKELKHNQSGLCLDRGSHMSMADAFASKCTGDPSQKWVFDHST